MTDQETKSSNTTADESHNTDDHTWTATPERPPYENVRTLLRQLGPAMPTTTVLRIAYRRVPGAGPEDEAIVEHVREELAREQAIARAKRWYCACADPPTITIPAEQTTAQDSRIAVAPEIITAAERYLSEREHRCENRVGVIGCTGSARAGYRCPDCLRQDLRETAILNALLDAMVDHAPEAQLPAITDGGGR